jgi:hypothetical protein
MADYYYWLDEFAQIFAQEAEKYILPEMTDEQIAAMVLPAVKRIWEDCEVTQKLVPGGEVLEEQWSAAMNGTTCEVHVQQRVMPPIHITVNYTPKREPIDDYVQKIIDRRKESDG